MVHQIKRHVYTHMYFLEGDGRGWGVRETFLPTNIKCDVQTDKGEVIPVHQPAGDAQK